MVGGNIEARVLKTGKGVNAEGVPTAGEPQELMRLEGWLDYQGGDASHSDYQAKVQDTTHLFICDYREGYAALSENGLSLEVAGRVYEVLLIDDPMGLHEHIETYLRYVGGA